MLVRASESEVLMLFFVLYDKKQKHFEDVTNQQTIAALKQLLVGAPKISFLVLLVEIPLKSPPFFQFLFCSCYKKEAKIPKT